MTADRDLPGAAPRQELPRPFPVARVGAGADFVVEATIGECRALAARMGIVAVHSLVCRFGLQRGPHETVAAEGTLRARVSQTCVVSLEPFEADLAEDFALRFVPAGQESDELDLDSDDEVSYAGGVLELGEAAAEQLALLLDPFPRKPGATLTAVDAEQEGGAFAALSRLLPPH